MPKSKADPHAVSAKSAVAAVVLAAGASRRFAAGAKLFADIEGRCVLERVLETVAAAGLRDVVVVGGPAPDRVTALAAAHGCRAVRNPRHEDGLASSIAAGICALPAGIDGAFVCLGDMPLVRSSTLLRMAAAFAARGALAAATIVTPAHAGRRGHPVLFGSGFFPELAGLSGDGGARPVRDAHAGDEILLDVDDEGIHFDIDTEAELAEARAVFRRDPGSGY